MKKLSFIYALLWCIPAIGQNALRWQMNLGGEIKWFSVAPNGTLIAAQVVSHDSTSYTRLSGIDPETGVVKWNFEPSRKNIFISGVDAFQGTNKLQLRDMPFTLLDPVDGRVLFESQNTYGNGVSRMGVIKNTSTLWVESSDSARVFYLFDFEKQKLLWLNTNLFEGTGVANKISVGTHSITSHNVSAATLLCEPLIFKDYMIVATHQGVFKISLVTGLLIWKVPLPDPKDGVLKLDLNQETVRLFTGENHFFFVRGQYIMAINYDDGKSAWINFVKTSGPVEKIYFDTKGIVLMPSLSETKGVYGETRITMVNEMTGENLWIQEPSFNGTVTHYAPTANGLGVAMKNSIDVNTLNTIDLTSGKFIWPSSLKLTGQLQKLEGVPKGLLYATLHAANVLDLNGNPIIDLPTQGILRKPIVSCDSEEKYYFFSSKENNLYAIDKKEGTGKIFNREPISFKGEEPEHIEVLADGIFLYAKQNILLLAPDGGVKFSVYKPSPSNLFAQLKKDVTKMVSKKDQSSVAAGGRSPNPIDFFYMMTRSDQSVIMTVIDRNSGEEIASVDFLPGDDQPTYRIDREKGIIFYAPKGKDDYGNPTHVGEIQCWKF